MMLDT